MQAAKAAPTRQVPAACAALAVLLGWLTGCTSAPASTSPRAEKIGPAGFTRTDRAAVSSSTRWRVVYRTPANRVLLTGLTAISPVDAWVVGVRAARRGGPVVLHWNGKRWFPITPPGVSGLKPATVLSTSAGNVWIFGQNAAGGFAAVRFDGRSWHRQPVPAGNWIGGFGVLLGAKDVWLVSGSCRAGNRPSRCRSQLARWNGRRWALTLLPVLVSGLAEAGGRVWVVGVAGLRSDTGAGGRVAGTGTMVVYRQAATGWVRVPAPIAKVGTGDCEPNPQLAAGPAGQAWILCLTPVRKSSHGTLYSWSGRQWSQLAIPAHASDRQMDPVNQLSYDGHDGVWLGPFAHWTGRRWISVSQVGPGQPGTVLLGQAAGIPGAPSAWAIGATGGFITATPSGPGVIAVNGPLPG